MAAPSETASSTDFKNKDENLNKDCNSLYHELDRKLKDYSKKDTENETLLRCQCHLVKMKNVSPAACTWKDETQKTDWIKSYAQAILDLTFYEENELVDQDFPEPHGKVEVAQIIEDLLQVECLCKQLKGEECQIADILGEEIAECLRWRCGALLYMYCATLNLQPSRREKNRKHFCKCAKEGVQHLQSMLTVRTPLGNYTANLETNDKHMVTLLQNGVFSDTHMLALMYSGELCWWWLQNTDCHDQPDFPASQIGSSLLQKYLDMVNGPLKGHGWTSDRAEQLLREIRKQR